jgi:hypothetical protein
MFELQFEQPTWPEERENYCDRAGAEKLKATLEAYWSARGHKITAWVEQKGFSSAMRGAYWVVRSDLVDALPRPSPAQIERAA